MEMVQFPTKITNQTIVILKSKSLA